MAPGHKKHRAVRAGRLTIYRTTLASRDDAKAIGAAYELGSTLPGLDVLFDHFFSDDTDIRSIAAYGIFRAGKHALPQLLSRLDDDDPDLQLRIIDVIGDMGPVAVDAVQEITAIMASSDPPRAPCSVRGIGYAHPTTDDTGCRSR